MQNFSYTKSIALTDAIHRIDELRKNILLVPLSPRDELRLQWKTLLTKIHFSLALQGILIPEEQISSFLSPLGTQTPHPHSSLMLGYKRAFDYLYHHWLVNKTMITPADLVEFYKVCFPGSLAAPEEELGNSLKYIQINPEHPVIQAALAQIQILTTSPFTQNNEQFSQLTFHMFLYKYGYDMRRCVVFEEYFYTNLIPYKDMVAQSTRQQNVTPWLEYCATGVISSLQKTLNTLTLLREQDSHTEPVFDLSERQKLILDLFSTPNLKLTNKLVQRRFKVSQITASRDLAKLATIGLLIPIGKGRSTYYTKV